MKTEKDISSPISLPERLYRIRRLFISLDDLIEIQASLQEKLRGQKNSGVEKTEDILKLESTLETIKKTISLIESLEKTLEDDELTSFKEACQQVRKLKSFIFIFLTNTSFSEFVSTHITDLESCYKLYIDLPHLENDFLSTNEANLCSPLWRIRTIFTSGKHLEAWLSLGENKFKEGLQEFNGRLSKLDIDLEAFLEICHLDKEAIFIDRLKKMLSNKNLFLLFQENIGLLKRANREFVTYKIKISQPKVDLKPTTALPLLMSTMKIVFLYLQLTQDYSIFNRISIKSQMTVDAEAVRKYFISKIQSFTAQTENFFHWYDALLNVSYSDSNFKMRLSIILINNQQLLKQACLPRHIIFRSNPKFYDILLDYLSHNTNISSLKLESFNFNEVFFCNLINIIKRNKNLHSFVLRDIKFTSPFSLSKAEKIISPFKNIWEIVINDKFIESYYWQENKKNFFLLFKLIDEYTLEKSDKVKILNDIKAIIKKSNPAIFEWFLDGDSLIHYAVKKDVTEIFREILLVMLINSKDVRKTNSDRQNILGLAKPNGEIFFILKKEFSPIFLLIDEYTSKKDQTESFNDVKRIHPSSLLLSLDGELPLHYAAKKGTFEIFKYILLEMGKYKMDIWVKNKENETILTLAVAKNHQPMIKYINAIHSISHPYPQLNSRDKTSELLKSHTDRIIQVDTNYPKKEDVGEYNEFKFLDFKK